MAPIKLYGTPKPQQNIHLTAGRIRQGAFDSGDRISGIPVRMFLNGVWRIQNQKLADPADVSIITLKGRQKAKTKTFIKPNHYPTFVADLLTKAHIHFFTAAMLMNFITDQQWNLSNFVGDQITKVQLDVRNIKEIKDSDMEYMRDYLIASLYIIRTKQKYAAFWLNYYLKILYPTEVKQVLSSTFSFASEQSAELIGSLQKNGIININILPGTKIIGMPKSGKLEEHLYKLAKIKEENQEKPWPHERSEWWFTLKKIQTMRELGIREKLPCITEKNGMSNYSQKWVQASLFGLLDPK